MTAAVASSALAVTNTAEAATVSKAEQAVIKAEKLATALKWEISYEYRQSKYPKNVVGYPNMKVHNDTKKALADARKAVSGLKAKEKQVLEARLDQNVALHLNRSVAFVDAVTAGLKNDKLYRDLKTRVDKGLVDNETEKLYHKISKEIQKNAVMIYRVYGKSTRDAFNNTYKAPGENLRADLLYPITLKIEIDRAQKAISESNYQEAAERLGNVQYYLKEAEKAGLKQTDKLIQSSLSKLNATQTEFNKNAVLYIANSTNADAPSVFGPASGSETTNKTVYLYAGNDQHIKLQNVSIDGNLVVIGGKAGAGTVYLENVKVNKKGKDSGNIIVENIAEHSLYMKGVEAESLVVNDADGSNIVADEGVKVKKVLVSENAGQKVV